MTTNQASKVSMIDSDDLLAPHTKSNTSMQDKIKKQVAVLWQDLLNIDKIRDDLDFFSLGGTNLLALKFQGLVEQSFTKFPIFILYEYSTISQVADYILTYLLDKGKKKQVINHKLPAFTSDMIRFQYTYEENYATIIQLFNNAKRIIYYTAWQLDFYYPFSDGLNLIDLIKRTCDRGVLVKILLSSHSLAVNVVPTFIHKNCEIKLSKSYGKKLPTFYKWGNRIKSPTERVLCVHQRYLSVDNQYLMMQGTDIFFTRSGEVDPKTTYTWQEASVLIALTGEKEKKFIIDNYETDGKGKLESELIVGNFVGQNTEYKHIAEIIETAKHTLYIENQQFHYWPSTKNNVITLIIKRLEQAIELNQDFKIILFTNLYQIDMADKALLKMTGRKKLWFMEKVAIKMLTYNFYYTLFYIENYFAKRNISLQTLYNHIMIAVFEANSREKPLFIHQKIYIKDTQDTLLSSSNIHCRSFFPGADRETAVYLKNKPKAVETFQSKLFKQKGVEYGENIKSDYFSFAFKELNKNNVRYYKEIRFSRDLSCYKRMLTKIVFKLFAKSHMKLLSESAAIY